MNHERVKTAAIPLSVPEALVNELFACVYGPPSWYDKNGNLINRRWVDEPEPDIYGPLPPDDDEDDKNDDKDDDNVKKGFWSHVCGKRRKKRGNERGTSHHD